MVSFDSMGMIALICFAGFVLLLLIFYFIPMGLWFSALVSGVRISLLQLVLMRWRKVPPSTIVSAMIEGTKAGLKINANELEAHYLAGGNVTNVVHALVSAQKANINLDFQMATAIDLAGRDVFEAVQMSVNPKVINTPPVSAVAKDGIQLIAKARVTVRANIKQLVGGAGEETVLARVGEGIVSSIGSSETHKVVLENPDLISRAVLMKGLDAGTAFEILSIDIADIDVGKNIGAELQMDQANADKNIAQAKAEERRAMAIALEQENKAKAQDARARVIEAEAEVPLAHTEGLANYHNAFASIYEGRYLAGVAAGLKLNEMMAADSTIVPKMGYVGAFTYAEVISGYTSFYLGAKSVCPEVTMDVQFTGSWYDETKEKNAALALMDGGCVLISQHADSMGAPSACEERGVPNVSYNGSTVAACPDTFIVSSKIDWTPYFEYICRAVMDGTEIATDWTGTISTGSVALSEVNTNAAAANTQATLDDVKAKLISGEIKVFDTDTFTVGNEKLDSYLADVDTDAEYQKDTEVIKDGYFHESEYRSAPYFDLEIDGIKLLNRNYGEE